MVRRLQNREGNYFGIGPCQNKASRSVGKLTKSAAGPDLWTHARLGTVDQKPKNQLANLFSVKAN
jgi:hypothetical protein